MVLNLASGGIMFFTKDFLLIWSFSLLHFMTILLIMKQSRLLFWAWLSEFGIMLILSGLILMSNTMMLLGLLLELTLLPLLFLSLFPVMWNTTKESNSFFFLTLHKFPFLGLFSFVMTKEWIILLILIISFQTMSLFFFDKTTMLYAFNSMAILMFSIFIGLKSMSLSMCLMFFYLVSSLLLLGLTHSTKDLNLLIFLSWSPLTLSIILKMFLSEQLSLLAFPLILMLLSSALLSLLFILSLSTKTSYKNMTLMYSSLTLTLLLLF